jgi:ubiquinone/menaquinone biosynthesis C-methylase UbiE
MEPKDHWENVYTTKNAAEVSWFQEHAHLSLKLIEGAGLPKTSSIIDIGGGASTLVDDLLGRHYTHLTVLDLSSAALNCAQSRLGKKAEAVNWIEANILEAPLPSRAFDVWHDRAVFHFLTTETERRAYVQKVLHAVKPGGLVLIATFAEDGPTKCSGLPVMRYSATELHAEFGDHFLMIDTQKEAHITPGGNEQRFVYCLCRKVGA